MAKQINYLKKNATHASATGKTPVPDTNAKGDILPNTSANGKQITSALRVSNGVRRFVVVVCNDLQDGLLVQFYTLGSVGSLGWLWEHPLALRLPVAVFGILQSLYFSMILWMTL